MIDRAHLSVPEFDRGTSGSARWMETGYLVNLKHGLGVDLIQGDKSAFGGYPETDISRFAGASPGERERYLN